MTLYSESSYSPNDPYSFPIERLKSFAKESSKIFRQSAEKYKVNYQLNDIRHNVFHDLFVTCNSCLVFAILMEQNTESTIWWSTQKEFGNSFIDNRLVKQLNFSLRGFLKFGHFHCMCMFIEDAFRVMVRKIDKNACKEGTDNFNVIYCFVLQKVSLQKYEQLFKLYSVFRNSIHNNGYYFPINKNSNPINYNGKYYNFQYGKELDVSKFGFNDIFDFVFYLYGELNKILNDIFDSMEISKIGSIIKPI